jgi:cell division protein FtsB
MAKNRWQRPRARESDEDRVRLYGFRVRRNEGLRRASNYTLVFAVLFGLSGAALGLFPEWEKVRTLRQGVAELGKARDDVLRKRDYLRKSFKLLEAGDLDYIESRAREKSGNLQAPGEVLLRVPSARSEEKLGEPVEIQPAAGEEKTESLRPEVLEEAP